MRKVILLMGSPNDWRVMKKATDPLRGLDVRQSEVHGLAQRGGGTVVTHVRYGQRVHAPLIRAGETQLLIGFEPAEAPRYAGLLAKGGAAVVNLRRWPPPAVSRDEATYPGGALRAAGCAVYQVDADAIARDASDRRAFGSVLLGAASIFLPLTWTAWDRAFTRVFPSGKLQGINKNAFTGGLDSIDL